MIVDLEDLSYEEKLGRLELFIFRLRCIFLYLTGQGQKGFFVETQPFTRSPNGKQSTHSYKAERRVLRMAA